MAQEQVFEFQSIHGIKAQYVQEDQSKVRSISLLIWGGRRLALARITFSHPDSDGHSSACSLAIGPDFEATDWILDASFAISTHLPTAAYFVTAHNDVFVLTSDPSRDLHMSILQVASGISSILYSAHIKPVSNTTILVAAGTAFGEVIVWSCYSSASGKADIETRWHSRTHNVFRGHDGSIFGVCLSDTVELTEDYWPRRLLASCSDDRTIRLWDVSDCDENLEGNLRASRQHHENVRETGLGSVLDASIGSTWGHASRVWGVDFIRLSGDSSKSPLHLLTRGEDATCQVWKLARDVTKTPTDITSFRRRRLRINLVGVDHHHFGKHIWSYVHTLEEVGPVVFTGGGDGGIISRSVFSQGGDGSYFSIQTSFNDLFESMKPKMTRNDSVGTRHLDTIKQYVFVSADILLATTNQGDVIVGVIEAHKQNPCQPLNIKWSVISDATEIGAVAIIESDTIAGVVCLGTTTGNIWVYQQDSFQLLAAIHHKISRIFTGTLLTRRDGSPVRHFLVDSMDSLTAKLLQTRQLNRDSKKLQVSETVELSLPPTFQPTACLEVADADILILGSRSGALAIYHVVAHQSKAARQISPAICVRHIHGSNTVTDLRLLPATEGSAHDSSYCDILSTGRDGSYAIHRVNFENDEAGSTTAFLTTLHRSCPLFGPNVEGATITMTKSGTMELLLHGFDGTNFVVWNESTKSEVMNVPCGGSHRSWAYSSNCTTSQLGRISQGGCFVWTKAGVFNMARFDSPSHEIVQAGGHGREIKAMAAYEAALSHNASHGPPRRLIATGAEDTAIRLWLVMTSGVPAKGRDKDMGLIDTVSCIHILKKHKTGIQHLSFCKDFLFSSAGCEELFIWKINFDVSVVGIGTVFQAALPKYANASDLRITSFEITCLNGDSASEVEHFLISTAYSNSMVRVFKYTNNDLISPDDRFQLVGEGFYNTTCLTNITRLPGSPWFVTASTNGGVAVWPRVDHLIDVQDSPAKLSHVAEHHVHQNAIFALQTIHLILQYHLLLTGGDDNAFGITLVSHSALEPTQRQDPENDHSLSSPRFATLLIPKAHAVAITAFEILESRHEAGRMILTVVTAGNDQRLKFWRITVNLDELSTYNHEPRMDNDKLGPEVLRSVEVQLIKEMWTSVADVSSTVVVPGANEMNMGEEVEAGGGAEDRREGRLMIAGIGMEMVWVGLADAED